MLPIGRMGNVTCLIISRNKTQPHWLTYMTCKFPVDTSPILLMFHHIHDATVLEIDRYYTVNSKCPFQCKQIENTSLFSNAV